MSHHPNNNHIKQSYELIDVDNDDDTDDVYECDDNNNSNNIAGNLNVSTNTPVSSSPGLQTVLPNGELMDGKNTLQSFDIYLTSKNNTVKKSTTSQQQQQQDSPPFTLPNGQIMDSKNTLQSFDNNRNNVTAHVVITQPPAAITTTAAVKPSIRTNNPTLSDSTNYIHAVAVQSFAVAEVETIDPGIQIQDEELTPQAPKRNSAFWTVLCFGILLGAIVGGVGVAVIVITQSNNDSSPTSTPTIGINNSLSNPTTNKPTSEIPSFTPTIVQTNIAEFPTGTPSTSEMLPSKPLILQIVYPNVTTLLNDTEINLLEIVTENWFINFYNTTSMMDMIFNIPINNSTRMVMIERMGTIIRIQSQMIIMGEHNMINYKQQFQFYYTVVNETDETLDIRNFVNDTVSQDNIERMIVEYLVIYPFRQVDASNEYRKILMMNIKPSFDYVGFIDPPIFVPDDQF